MSVKRLISILLLGLLCIVATAQKRVQASVEEKTLKDGKVSTVTKRVFSDVSGRLVTVFYKPLSYYSITNTKGEARVYLPSTNEVVILADPSVSSSLELINIFHTGRQTDMGLIAQGYTLSSSSFDEGYLKRIYATTRQDLPAEVELVLKDYLPIYLEYRNASGKVLGKTYLSQYDRSRSFVMPGRVTEITYLPQKKDSVVTRTLYTDISTEGTDPTFDFQVPADARPATNPLSEALKKAKQ